MLFKTTIVSIVLSAALLVSGSPLQAGLAQHCTTTAADFDAAGELYTVDSCGGVIAPVGSPHYGDLPQLGIIPDEPVLDILLVSKGYALLGRDGGVFAFGNFPFLGSAAGTELAFTSIAPLPDMGYILITDTGLTFKYTGVVPPPPGTTQEAWDWWVVNMTDERLRHWTDLAWCETRNRNIASSTGNYRGYYQFHADSWALVDGTGDPMLSSLEEQTYRAERLLDIQGTGAWPGCKAKYAPLRGLVPFSF